MKEPLEVIATGPKCITLIQVYSSYIKYIAKWTFGQNLCPKSKGEEADSKKYLVDLQMVGYLIHWMNEVHTTLGNVHVSKGHLEVAGIFIKSPRKDFYWYFFRISVNSIRDSFGGTGLQNAP